MIWLFVIDFVCLMVASRSFSNLLYILSTKVVDVASPAVCCITLLTMKLIVSTSFKCSQPPAGHSLLVGGLTKLLEPQNQYYLQPLREIILSYEIRMVVRWFWTISWELGFKLGMLWHKMVCLHKFTECFWHFLLEVWEHEAYSSPILA